MRIDQRGFTLVEVLAVSAIIVILLSGIFSFFIMSQRMYHSGTRQADLHHAVRISAERVIRELRYANELMLLEDWEVESANPEQYSYIYYDQETKTIMLLDQSGNSPLSDSVVSGFSFSTAGNTVFFTIVGESRSSKFTLNSSVSLLNFNGLLPNPENPGALRFSLPALGSAPDPDPTPDPPDPTPDPPDPTPDPPDPTPEPPDPDPDPGSGVELRILHQQALPVADQSYPQHTATLTWEEQFDQPITEISLSLFRQINGHRQNHSSSFTGEWQLSIKFNGADHVVITENIVQPTGRNAITKTFNDFIPANVPVIITLNINYWYGGHNRNWVKPEFEDFQLTVIFFP